MTTFCAYINRHPASVLRNRRMNYSSEWGILVLLNDFVSACQAQTAMDTTRHTHSYRYTANGTDTTKDALRNSPKTTYTSILLQTYSHKKHPHTSKQKTFLQTLPISQTHRQIHGYRRSPKSIDKHTQNTGAHSNPRTTFKH